MTSQLAEVLLKQAFFFCLPLQVFLQLAFCSDLGAVGRQQLPAQVFDIGQRFLELRAQILDILLEELLILEQSLLDLLELCLGFHLRIRLGQEPLPHSSAVFYSLLQLAPHICQCRFQADHAAFRHLRALLRLGDLGGQRLSDAGGGKQPADDPADERPDDDVQRRLHAFLPDDKCERSATRRLGGIRAGTRRVSTRELDVRCCVSRRDSA
ncbi:MAG: hypothetical protein NZ552_07005, partial [Planctomycetes bacterium]|nr:hypothetical protein [Planctomycetota bacterium]